MQVLSFNYSDTIGGASRAAYRIHKALLSAGVSARLIVNDKGTDEGTVEGPAEIWGKLRARWGAYAGSAITRILADGNPMYSPAAIPSQWHKRINTSSCDLVHLHWINGEMMSIADIGRIAKPVVWTLHDMWAFCGAEHVNTDGQWRLGAVGKGDKWPGGRFDINRWVWRRKYHRWQKPMLLAAPSRWMAGCIRDSRLMHEWPVHVIPNPIDTDIWAPVERNQAKALWGFPSDKKILIFGTFGVNAAYHKGLDLLQEALLRLSSEVSDLEVVVYGQIGPTLSSSLGFPVRYIGHVRDDLSLRLLYAAADVVAIPSRIDNLPNAGVEAMACGTPVVAFDTCGLSDIVDHRQNGYLAEPFNIDDYARGISWILGEQETSARLSSNARAKAVNDFSFPVVAQQYVAAYQAALSM